MLTTLYEIARTINSILDLKELLNKVMDLAIDLVGAERGLIFMYRSETDEMEMVVGRNLEHQTIKDATEYSRSILKEAGLGRSILSHDAGSDERFKGFKSVTMFNIRSLLCVPLKIGERVIVRELEAASPRDRAALLVGDEVGVREVARMEAPFDEHGGTLSATPAMRRN